MMDGSHARRAFLRDLAVATLVVGSAGAFGCAVVSVMNKGETAWR
jgi:hypothetical protein